MPTTAPFVQSLSTTKFNFGRKFLAGAASLALPAFVAAGVLGTPAGANAENFFELDYGFTESDDFKVFTGTQKAEIEKGIAYLNSMISGSSLDAQYPCFYIRFSELSPQAGTGVVLSIRTSGEANSAGKMASYEGDVETTLHYTTSDAVFGKDMLQAAIQALGLGQYDYWKKMGDADGLATYKRAGDTTYPDRYLGEKAIAAWQLEFGQTSAKDIALNGPYDFAKWASAPMTSIFSGASFADEIMVTELAGEKSFISNVSIGGLVDLGFKFKAPDANTAAGYDFTQSFLMVKDDEYFNRGRMGEKGIMVWGELTNDIQGGVHNVTINVDSDAIVALMVANSYTGETIVKSGILHIGDDDALGTNGSGRVTISGGVMDVAARDIQISSLKLTGGVIANTQYGQRVSSRTPMVGSLTALSDMDMQAGDVYVNLSGVYDLKKTTGGTVTLYAATDFTGNTDISEGTLRVAHADALAKSSIVSVKGGSLNIKGVMMAAEGTVVLASGSIAGTGAIAAATLKLEDGLVSASIAGDGTVTKENIGTVTLSNTNYFEKGITVQAGTLIAAGQFSLSSFVEETKWDPATRQDVTTIVSTGEVTLSGGTLQLANIYAAAGACLKMEGGTLEFTGIKTAVLGSLCGDKDIYLINNDDVVGVGVTLAIGNNGQDSTYDGVFKDEGLSGALVKIGTGTLELTQNSSFSGGTTVSDGTLVLKSEKTLGDGLVSVVGGTLQTSGTTTFDGGLAVSGGVAEIAGGLAAGRLNANEVGVFGTGTFSPGGAEISAVEVFGSDGGTRNKANFVIAESGTLLVDVKGNNAGDVVTVYGTATFSGGYVKIGSGSVAAEISGFKHTFLIADEILGRPIGVRGETNADGSSSSYVPVPVAGSTTDTYAIPVGYRVGVNPDNTRAHLYVSYDYASERFLSTLNSNQTLVAYMLNDLETATGLDGNTPSSAPKDKLLRAINEIVVGPGESFSALAEAYDSLMPVNMMTVSRSLTKQANSLTNNFDRRTRSVRRGSILPGSIWTNYLFTDSYGFDYSAHPLVASNDNKVPYLGLGDEYPITLWLNGGGSYWKGKADGSSPTTKSTQYAANIGIDYTWQTGYGSGTYIYSVGLLAGYGNITDKIGSNSSKNEIGAASLGIYGSIYSNGFFGNILASYAMNSYDFKRDISIGSLKQTAKASPDGGQYLGYINGGYEWEYRNWMHGPIVSLQYSNSSVDGYTETGADNQNLTVGKQTFDSLLAAIGWRVSTRIETETATWLPEVRISYNHEFLNDGGAITSSMQNPDARPFTVQTADAGRDYVNVGFGVTVLLSETVSVSLDYDASLFQKNTDPQHTINAMVRVSF